MKRFTEIVCDMYATKIDPPMRTIVIRPSNLYGPHDKFGWETSKVIAALVRRAVERHDPFVVWGDGQELKDFLYIDDFINGLLLALESEELSEPINISSGLGVTVREIVDEVLAAADYEDAVVRFDSSKPTMIPKRIVDNTVAKERLGFIPHVSLREGIRRTVDWYEEHRRSQEFTQCAISDSDINREDLES